MKKTFSVLIPVYNVEKYLKQCLDSVLAQNWENIEVILVDDGSTDNSGKICEEYAANDYRIKVIHKKNEGLLLARRTAIKEATGDYFMFLDSDDYWEEGLLGSVSAIIDKYNCDLVLFNYKNVYLNKQEKNESLFENESVFEGETKKEIYKIALEGTELNNLVLKIVKKDIVDIYDDYREFKDVSNAEDAMQSAPLLVKAKKIVYLDECFYCYRKQTGMTSYINAAEILSITKARGKITQIYEDTKFDLKESIEKEHFNYLKNFKQYILYGYMDNPSILRQSCEAVFSTDFYKRAKKSAYKKQSLLSKVIINCAEKNNYKIISVMVYALKLRNKLKELIKKYCT